MQAGHQPVILDRMQEAKAPRGFVYLHENMDLPLTPRKIHVLEQGTAEDYARKVYGDKASATEVSFGKFSGWHVGFEPAELLNILNGIQHKMVVDANLGTRDEVFELIQREGFEKTVFTLPVNKFWEGNYPFTYGSVGSWKLNEGEVLNDFCVYNANPGIPWYRSGSMFGYAFREFPTDLNDHLRLVKVLDGDGPPEIHGVLFTGRFGKWSKKALSHDTYHETMKFLS
jgi:hypothetical protein